MVAKKVKVPLFKMYKVVEKFKGYINDKRFDCKKGDVITLTDDEYRAYRRFVEICNE